MSTLYLHGDIDSGMVGGVLTALDEGEVSRIVLNSQGGSICDALAIYDSLIGKDITVIATGHCMSAAVIVLLAGHNRFATEHTRFLTHPVSMDGDKVTPADVQESSLLSHTVAELIHRRGTLSSLKAEELLRHEQYFGAAYAQRIGLIHGIWQGESIATPGFVAERTN